MAGRTKPVIKQFLFEAFDRRGSEIGDRARIKLSLSTVQLQGPPFSTEPDAFVRTRVTQPGSVKRWTGFYVEQIIARDFAGTPVTSFGFRLSDGVNDRYWDGAAWVSASPSDWNTEAEIAGNIREYPVEEQKMQVVINPTTTNPALTPRLNEIRLSYDSDVDDFEDYIWRTLIPLLKEQFRPIGQTAFRTQAETIDFKLQLDHIEIHYDIVSIDSVFDSTADPRGQTDLFGSYDAETTVVTLNAPVPAGNVILCKFIYKPSVQVTTDQDYFEIADV